MEILATSFCTFLSQLPGNQETIRNGISTIIIAEIREELRGRDAGYKGIYRSSAFKAATQVHVLSFFSAPTNMLVAS
jgi:hypothetical protein